MKKQLQGFISIVWWVLVCVAALLAMIVMAVKVLLPYLDDYRSQIESNLSQLTGYQVTLNSIGGHLEGIDPTVSVNDLVMSVNGKPAVAVSEVRVRINTIKSLLTLTPQFTYVRFVKPLISFQELDGQWRLQGSPPSSDVQNDVGVERILGYLTAQQRFSVLNAKININSQQFGNHSVVIPKAYIFQRSQASWVKSKVYIDGNAAPFDINAKIYQSLGIFGAYQVDANVNVPNISIPFSGQSPSWAADLASADFAGKLWLNYRIGEGFVLQAKSSKLIVAFKNGEMYQASPSIRVRYGQRKEGLSVDIHRLAIEDVKGEISSPMNVSYERSASTGQSYIRFDRLDLALAHRFADHFLSSELQASKLLSGLAPSGMMSNAFLRFGVKNKAITYHFLSDLQHASVAGYQGIPKVNNVDAVFSLTESDGYIQFRSRQGKLAFPALYNDEWQVNSLSGSVDWQLVQNTLIVNGRGLKIHRNGTDIGGGFRFESRQNSPDWLSLSINAQHVPVSDRLTYLPSGALNKEVQDWIKNAFADRGEVNNLDLLVQTELADGVKPDVRLKMDVSNAEVAFNQDWPVAKSVNGQFTLNESGVHVQVKSASLAGVGVSNILVDVPIADGVADWLNVKGGVTQESSQILGLLQSTPLADNVLAPFKTWHISGKMNGTFDVSIPLNNKHSQPVVSLSLGFKNNPVVIGDIGLNTVVDKGQLNYSTGKGISDSSFDVEALSGVSHLELSSSVEKDGRISVAGDLSGTANLYQIAEWRKLPKYLANNIAGDIGYHGTLAINKVQEGQVDLLVKSDLKGGLITLPEPFSKASIQTTPFSMKVMAHHQDVIVQTDFSSLAKAQFLVSAGEFIGGEVYFNSDKMLPKKIQKGLVLGGQFASFDVADWKKVFDKFSGQNNVAVSSGKNNFNMPSWLHRVDVLIDEVVVNPQNTLHNVKMKYDTDETKGKLQVSSDELNFVFDHADNKPRLHFGYLNWNTANDTASGSPDQPPFHARQVPNMILAVDQLYINQKPYGDWHLNIIRSGNQLRIDPFSSNLKTGKFDGHLIWQDNKVASSVKLAMFVEGKDLAELTSKFSDKAFVTSKNYKIKVILNWKGHPLYFDRKSVSGTISFDAKDGNFSQVDELPAFMKIFGIFNVESLRRRLSLDFSDVYKPGLTYDSFTGDFNITKGILKTIKPLHVVSPTAEVSLEGKADIVNETLDETLTATLPITRSLPLAGLLWGTPQLAGILYLTDKLIGDKISKATSVQYKIEGSFDSPIVTPVKHKPVKRVDH